MRLKSMKIVIALMLVLAFVLSGCGNQSANNAGNGKTSDSSGKQATKGKQPPKTVDFWYAIAGANGKVVQKLVDEYNSSQNKYKVNATFVPPAQRLKKLTVAIASGSTPDLFTAGPPDVAALTNSSQLLSIDSLAKNSDKKIDKNSYFKALQDIVVKNGKLYGVPISTGVTGLYYNEDLFKKNGITGAPQTWDEMIQDAQKLTDPSKGQWGMLLPTKEMAYTARMWATFLTQAGGSLLNKDNTKAAFNSKEGVEALQLWVDIFNKYKVAPLKEMDEDTTTQTFATGKVGMFFGYPLWTVESKKFPFTTKTARTTKKVRRASSLGGWYLVVPKLGNNAAGAYDFLAWLSQPDHAVQWNLGMGNLPTTQAAVDTKAYKSFLKANPLVQPFDVALAKDAYSPPATGKFNQVLQPLERAIQLAIYKKETPKQALDEAAAQVNKTLAAK